MDQNIKETSKVPLLPVALPFNVPVGAIIMYAGKAEDTWLNQLGWMICDGRALSKTDDRYLSLYRAIQNAFGATADKFYIPDCRGMFVRGVDMGRNKDPDCASRKAQQPGGNIADAVGTVQNDELRAHNHSLSKSSRSFEEKLGDNMPYSNKGSKEGSSGNAGGKETRPANLYLYYIIKFSDNEAEDAVANETTSRI